MPTSVGEARVAWYPALGKPRAILTVGHGTATGIEAPDLQAPAKTLPARGITVALVEQPYRVVGDPLPVRADDSGHRELWPRFESARLPVIAGGRSAGSQVACQTARDLKALATPSAVQRSSPRCQLAWNWSRSTRPITYSTSPTTGRRRSRR